MTISTVRKRNSSPSTASPRCCTRRNDILADAKDVNEQRAVDAEAEVIEDAAETVEEKAAE